MEFYIFSSQSKGTLFFSSFCSRFAVNQKSSNRKALARIAISTWRRRDKRGEEFGLIVTRAFAACKLLLCDHFWESGWDVPAGRSFCEKEERMSESWTKNIIAEVELFLFFKLAGTFFSSFAFSFSKVIKN